MACSSCDSHRSFASAKMVAVSYRQSVLLVSNSYGSFVHPRGFKIGWPFLGVNYEGPAPRPLERFKLSLGDSGDIVVDQSIMFRQEKGEQDKLGAFLPYA